MSRTQPQRAPQVRTPTRRSRQRPAKRIPGPGPDVATHSTRSLGRQASTHTHTQAISLHSVHMMHSHVVRRTRVDPDTTSNSTCTYVYAPDPWAVAGLLWQICFHCMIKPRPKSLLRRNSLENWHSISDWCSVNSASIPSAITITATVSLSNNLSQPWPVLACVTLQVSCSEEREKKNKKTTRIIFTT